MGLRPRFKEDEDDNESVVAAAINLSALVRLRMPPIVELAPILVEEDTSSE